MRQCICAIEIRRHNLYISDGGICWPGLQAYESIMLVPQLDWKLRRIYASILGIRMLLMLARIKVTTCAFYVYFDRRKLIYIYMHTCQSFIWASPRDCL